MKVDLSVRLVVTDARSGPHVEVRYGDQAWQMPVAMEAGEDGPVACNTEGELVLDVPVPRPGAALAARRARKFSKKQERELAEAIEGKVQPGSGCVPGSKGDFRIPNVVRGEAKFTYASRYELELADLRKIRSECAGSERMSLLVRFLSDDGRTRDEFALVSRQDWEEWVEFKKGQRG